MINVYDFRGKRRVVGVAWAALQKKVSAAARTLVEAFGPVIMGRSLPKEPRLGTLDNLESPIHGHDRSWQLPQRPL